MAVIVPALNLLVVVALKPLVGAALKPLVVPALKALVVPALMALRHCSSFALLLLTHILYQKNKILRFTSSFPDENAVVGFRGKYFPFLYKNVPRKSNVVYA